MIPQFPMFKNLELSDKAKVTDYTQLYPPYSDFNFTNLWSWDTTKTRKISNLNGNLVVLFTDYRTTETYLSFLGNNKPTETSLTLLKYASTNNVTPVLKFIASEIAKKLSKGSLVVKEDPTNHDYIFSVADIATNGSSKLKSKRRQVEKFTRENPTAKFCIQSFSHKKTKSQIAEIMKCWETNKINASKFYEIKHEEIALSRIVDHGKEHDLVFSCLRDKDKMIAFSIDEILPDNYAISHFIKADVTYKGSYEFINSNIAKYLSTLGVLHWNWEQDLNLEGLKRLKLSYQPAYYLKKYTVELVNNNITTKYL
jgi:uncharacterized protein